MSLPFRSVDSANSGDDTIKIMFQILLNVYWSQNYMSSKHLSPLLSLNGNKKSCALI